MIGHINPPNNFCEVGSCFYDSLPSGFDPQHTTKTVPTKVSHDLCRDKSSIKVPSYPPCPISGI